MRKSLYFTAEHQILRKTLQEFFAKEILPYTQEWEDNRRIPRHIWELMGEMGYLGLCHEQQYGGSEIDFFCSVVFLEELGKTNAGFQTAISVHAYMATNHIARAGSDYLKEKYLRPAIAGKLISALAISEPEAGSDVQAIRTTAKRDGDFYVINGSKTWITNGTYCDFYEVAVKTDKGISLIIVEGEQAGVTRTKLNKMGLHSSDTAEIAFQDVRVPVANLIGEEGKGFYYIMDSFQLERLVAAIMSVGGMDWAMAQTLEYMAQRQTFGRTINKYQALRHTIAQLASEIEQNRQFVYHTAWLHEQGEFCVKECSMAKLLSTELSKRVIDECLQMFGGYGYVEDFPICRAYRDVRVGTIAGGTTQIMREIIAKMVIDDVQYKPAYSETEGESKLPTAREIIASLPARFRPEKAGEQTIIVHYDITGEQGGKFTIRIEAGKCSVGEGWVGKPTCTIALADTLYADLELGKADAQTAFMSGKIQVSNLPAMMQFSKCFKRVS
ncbi:MAG: acyl-CoA dehydrogenase [Bacteroidetes bacterium]|nr:MAG: acyl-CoA dehydrogenase [Bacteroidota bacterium]